MATEKAASSQAMYDALNVIEGQAVFAGAEHDAHVRVAQHKETIYIDLGTPDWRAIEVTATGWQVIENPPVGFRRAKAMMALPMATKGGAVGQLRRSVNVSDDDWPLVVAWLLAAMQPVGPYPVLCLHGEQGSEKATGARVLTSLGDPSSSPVRSEPREPRDLMIAAKNGRVIALDNLSRLPVWLADNLCRLSTGGGFSTRMLYHNDEEIIFDPTRPVIINEIEELATRSDLPDRSMLVNLPTIPSPSADTPIHRCTTRKVPRKVCQTSRRRLRKLRGTSGKHSGRPGPMTPGPTPERRPHETAATYGEKRVSIWGSSWAANRGKSWQATAKRQPRRPTKRTSRKSLPCQEMRIADESWRLPARSTP